MRLPSSEQALLELLLHGDKKITGLIDGENLVKDLPGIKDLLLTWGAEPDFKRKILLGRVIKDMLRTFYAGDSCR